MMILEVTLDLVDVCPDRPNLEKLANGFSSCPILISSALVMVVQLIIRIMIQIIQFLQALH